MNEKLNAGTSVKVQARDTNKAATITVDSEIQKSSGEDTSFTLEAQSNITINKQQFTAFKPLAHRPKPMLAKP